MALLFGREFEQMKVTSVLQRFTDPGTGRRGARLWQWMEETCRGGTWILGGDWNSVESFEDSVGASPVQRGTEQRKWSSLAGALDLADGWTEATQRSGPHFTRQKQVGSRLDQVRLDRIYVGRNMQTADKTLRMKHDDEERMSDHYPIWLRLEKRREGARQKTTYFKTSPEILKREGTKAEMKKRWEEAGNRTGDAGVRWELKWSATRSYLKELHREEQQKRREAQIKLDELRGKLKEAARERKNEADEELARLIEEVKTIEQKQAVLWKSIVTDEGDKIEEEDAIFGELHRFYSLLYKQDTVTEEALIQRREALSLIQEKVSPEENRKLIQIPETEEVRLVIKELKSDEAPGVDWMTAEAIQEIWDIAEQDVVDMV
ncbi:hypothetical protein R1sor_005151 [Riccia sorocarpa]|uniref:Endonuclease/exonuclease/phosphatase domain-containing protein n=1 Tax=Riccia sorocarpa TaxID=122646 RepID=A0ABD3HIQ7_9MARC